VKRSILGLNLTNSRTTQLYVCSVVLLNLTILLLSLKNSGVSSFNEFIHELSFDASDAESSSEYSTYGEEEYGDPLAPSSPLSTSSRISRTSSFSKYDRRLVRFVRYVLSWMLWPITLLLWSPLVLLQLFRERQGRSGTSSAVGRKTLLVKEHVVQRATDRRRGVIEVIFRLILS
jgi:hypothetical protein